MMPFDPEAYGPVFAPLLTGDRRRQLDAGQPGGSARSVLEAVTVETAFGHARIADHDAARCCLSAMWLLHDFLDESHKISQEIDTTSGSFWHGIMHRREGDFSNAKYWFRRVGQHAIFAALARRASEIDPALSGHWDPYAFIDYCERAVGAGGESERRAIEIQSAEWELLFEHCVSSTRRG